MSLRIQEAVNKRVKQGKLSPEEGEAIVHKLNLTDQFMELYKEISKSPESRFTEETLREANIELISWDIKTSEGQPAFFKQIPFKDFQLYHVPKFALRELLDPRQYCNAAKLKLLGCLAQAFNRQTDEPLLFDGGWHGEKYNYSMLHERGDEDNLNHRYEWGVERMFAHEGVPHTIALSTHQCDEPDRILRSELMILLLLMWAKARLSTLLYEDVTPLLLVSIRHNHFRIIEAYYDGSKVVVRYSGPLPLEVDDSPEKQQQTSHWVLRWLVAKPVGETKGFPSLKKTPAGS